jgi:hypothetical protein
MFAVTKSLHTDGWIDVDPCTPEPHGNQCVRGVDGHNYTGYGIVPSLVVYPAFVAGRFGASLLRKDPDVVAGATVSLMGAFLTPLIPVLLCAWLVALGYSVRVAILTALVLGFATPLWFHGAKGFYSEPYFTLALVACCYLLHQSQRRASAWLAGSCFGLAIGSRVFGLVLFPILLWYLFRIGRRDNAPGSSLLKRLVAFSLPVGVCVALLGALNYVRFGSPLKTGYHLAFPTLSDLFATPLSQGLSGVLLSGEVGLVWFTPVILLLPFTWRGFKRDHSDEAWLCLGISAATIVFFAKYAAWHGGWSYGPRLLVPILPFLVLPLSHLVARVIQNPDRRFGFAAWAVVTISLIVQVLGLISPVNRYYYLEMYNRAVGRTPWWSGSALLQNIDALPKLLTYRPEERPQFRSVAGAERRFQEERTLGGVAKLESPDAFLAAYPNSINLLTADLWLAKGRFFGLPKALAVTIAFVLLAIAMLSAHQLRLLSFAAAPGRRPCVPQASPTA